jgi:hypothetical protein
VLRRLKNSKRKPEKPVFSELKGKDSLEVVVLVNEHTYEAVGL